MKCLFATAFLLAFLTSNVVALDGVGVGVGVAMTCADMRQLSSQAGQGDEAAKARERNALAWSQGYLTGINIGRSGGTDASKMFAIPDAATLRKKIFELCLLTPDRKLFGVLAVFADSLATGPAK